MSKIKKSKLPCPLEGCNSSDAYHVYEDDSGYCFSCKRYTPPDGVGSLRDDYGYDYIPDRGITKESMAKYNVRSKYDQEGNVVAISFPYHSGSGSKVRDLTKPKSSQFYSLGNMSGPGLFGEELFSPGSARSITVVEGEYDALSVFQMQGSMYPCVSVRSSSQAKQDCVGRYEYLNSFERIYLCFDNDPVGQDAVAECASIFNPAKVYHVKLGQYKDANDYLQRGLQEQFKRAWYNAKPYIPDNIISSFADIDVLLEEDIPRSIAGYPWSVLQDQTKGIRSGEVILLTALEGIGKTEILRALEHHLIKHTDENIGIIHLEETQTRAIRGLVGYECHKPCHLNSNNVSISDVKQYYRDLTTRDNRVYLFDHFGSTDPDQILSAIRYMVSACSCKFVFLDHVSMVVSGLNADDERKLLDYITTKLAMMVKELDFTLFLVSHVNDEGLTRGSRNISKTALVHLHLNRNLEAYDEVERNTTHVTVRKNRPTGITGASSNLYFDPGTFMVSEVT